VKTPRLNSVGDYVVRIALILGGLAVAVCSLAAPPADVPPQFASDRPVNLMPLTTMLDPALQDRILALDPDRISVAEFRDVLAAAPAPRIINLQGSLPLVTMQAFADFLIAMGYPEAKVRNPRDGSYSYSSYADSRHVAGSLAWYYERDGMMPMMIGHSQGGMLAIRVLHELDGAFGDTIDVWNPLTDRSEQRVEIRDPITGSERPVIGLKVGYVTAIATGKLMRVLLGQWDMLAKLRQIPDTVENFTGFSIEGDLLTASFFGTRDAELYRATGSASVRNIVLPADYGHLSIPYARHLALQQPTREWIDRYHPQALPVPLPTDPGLDTRNLLHAADIWFSVKKQWCLEAQRLIRAQRNLLVAG
jgi:hypothetical protein